MAGLLLLVTAVTESSHGQVDPGQSGPGKAAPWSVEGTPDPPLQDPGNGGLRRPVRPRDNFWSRTERAQKTPRVLKCQILEVEELGRISIQETPSGDTYWIQLPPEVKIRTAYRQSFGGRKKLTLEDLEAGQRLVVAMKQGIDEIVKVMVTPSKV